VTRGSRGTNPNPEVLPETVTYATLIVWPARKRDDLVGVAGTLRNAVEQPVVNVQLHSTGAVSLPAALLLGRILPVWPLGVSCQSGASPVSVPREPYTTDC